MRAIVFEAAFIVSQIKSPLRVCWTRSRGSSQEISREPEKGSPLPKKALGRSRHVCACFNTRNEEYRVPLPSIKEGFERGTEVFVGILQENPLVRAT